MIPCQPLDPEAFPATRADATSALERDPGLASAHLALGDVALYYDRDLRSALAAYDRALHYAPASPEIRIARMWYYAIAGNAPKAHDEISAALAREPSSARLLTNAAMLDIFTRAFDHAARTMTEVIASVPDDEPARYTLATARALAENTKGALALYSGTTGHDRQTLAVLGFACGRAGDRAGALRYFNALQSGSSGYLSPFHLATICAGIGDLGATLHHLERGATERDPLSVIARVHPFFDLFRDDERFTSFLARAEERSPQS